MKSNPTFIFAGIMSAIVGNAYATGENTVTSKSYVDAQDALKQNLIPAKSTATSYSNASLVEASGTPGMIGERKIFDHMVDLDTETLGQTSDFYTGAGWDDDADWTELQSYIPTTGAVVDAIDGAIYSLQNKIAKSGYGVMGGFNRYTEQDPSNTSLSWLSSGVKGTGLVTKTNEDGRVGERKIFEETDVSGYHADGLTQNQKDIQDISIPTVGAMMTAISNGVNAATPTGTPNTIANYGANGELDSGIATYTGAAAYNATNDSAKIPTMAGVTTYAQAKKTCAGWPDGTTTYDATHTDANCWLWTFPD